MRLRAFATLLFAAGLPACEPAPEPTPPNILWIVWDTVRADHLGLYGYERATTPFLDEWALGARVYEDCLAAGVATVPSHASMFTGLAVGEHGSHNANPTLAEGLDTLAELLARSGYGTYVWSANPHISGSHGFTQGFEVEQHPWDDRNLERARALVREKLRTDEAERFEGRVERGNKVDWAVKASGTLAREGLTEWLDGIDGGRPWFAFLNYMEAHRELVSSRSYRERFLSPERVERSYEIDTSWKRTWGYTFGLEEYSPEELEILAGVYDAAIAELDDLLR
jgi:arylsulfatase A-like enzyme